MLYKIPTVSLQQLLITLVEAVPLQCMMHCGGTVCCLVEKMTKFKKIYKVFEVEVLLNEQFIVSINTTAVPLPVVITVINFYDPCVSMPLRTDCSAIIEFVKNGYIEN